LEQNFCRLAVSMSDEKMDTVSSYACDEYKESFPFSSAVEIVEVVSELSAQDKPKPSDPRTRLLKMLDGLDEDVEALRKSAMSLEEKKETLIGNLDVVRQSKVLDLLNEGCEIIFSRCEIIAFKIDFM